MTEVPCAPEALTGYETLTSWRVTKPRPAPDAPPPKLAVVICVVLAMTPVILFWVWAYGQRAATTQKDNIYALATDNDDLFAVYIQQHFNAHLTDYMRNITDLKRELCFIMTSRWILSKDTTLANKPCTVDIILPALVLPRELPLFHTSNVLMINYVYDFFASTKWHNSIDLTTIPGFGPDKDQLKVGAIYDEHVHYLEVVMPLYNHLKCKFTVHDIRC